MQSPFESSQCTLQVSMLPYQDKTIVNDFGFHKIDGIENVIGLLSSDSPFIDFKKKLKCVFYFLIITLGPTLI